MFKGSKNPQTPVDKLLLDSPSRGEDTSVSKASRASRPGRLSLTDNYSEDKFYTDSTDRRGHRGSVKVYLPQNLHGLLSAIATSPELPYRQFGDLVRDAIAHRLHFLQEHLTDPEFRNKLQIYISLEQLRQMKNRYDSERELVNNLRDMVYNPDLSAGLEAYELESALDAIETPALRAEMQHLIQLFISR